MTINPALGKLKYNFQSFTFRNEGSIKLPKSGNNNQFGRDNCYELADIVIVSTTKEQYRNFKSTPAHGFFGYASIVTQDCLLEPIPIKFARQRIYQEKVVEAYQSWQDLAVYLANTKKWFELLEGAITQGQAVSPAIKNICSIEAYSAKWTELSIREVYVKLPLQSQFRIELSWVSPESFTDGCGKTQDGKSKQPDDPKKDAGLPKSGIQPKINPPSNPFGGNPPDNGSVNDSRFDNAIGNIDNVNPANQGEPAIPADWGYFARLSSSYFTDASCGIRSFIAYRLINSADTLSVQYGANYSTCGGTGANGDLIGSVSGIIISGFPSTNKQAEFSIVRSPSLPPDVLL